MLPAIAQPVVLRIHSTQNDNLQKAFSALVFYGLYKDMFRRGPRDRITHALTFGEARRAARLQGWGNEGDRHILLLRLRRMSQSTARDALQLLLQMLDRKRFTFVNGGSARKYGTFMDESQWGHFCGFRV